MIDYATRQRPPRKHIVGLTVVLVLHGLLFWAINSGLARKFVKVVNGPVEAILLEETPPDIPPPPPPPPPPPQKNLPPPPNAYVPPVETQVAAPTPVNTIAAVASTPQAVAPPSPVQTAPAPVAAPVVTAAVISASGCEKPEYPSASKRMEEEGTVLLKFLVGVDGKVIESAIEKSSGFRRLDEAARAGLSKCQFKPSTLDGKPQQSWASMKFTWRLE
jgi:protein TonB